MQKHLLWLIAFAALACTNLDNGRPANRATFVRYYEGPYNLTATALEVIPSGYVILGNIFVSLPDTSFVQAALLDIDLAGTLNGDIHYYPGGSGKSFKPIYNLGGLAGFVVVGDSVFINPFAEQAGNVEISSMRLLLVDDSFNAIGNFYLSDNTSTGNQVRVDFTGEAIAVNAADGRIVVLGTRKANLTSPAEPFLLGIAPDFSSNWYLPYELIPGRTGINGKSIHYLGNRIFWTRALSEVQGSFINSWISLPVVEENSSFLNDNALGEYAEGGQYFLSEDLTVASNPAFGFGLTGTFSKSTDGSKANIFFARAFSNGTFVPGSLRFFDMSLSADGTPLADSTQSVVVDEGHAITATRDGGFAIAGTITTVPGVLGKGGKDMVLLKLDAVGNLQWYRLHGGSGDDIPVAIRETPDGLLIAGTHTLGNYSTIFLMKTDANGELKQ